MNKAMMLLSSLGLAWAIAGCHTLEGVGKDVKAAGRAVADAATKAKSK